MTSSPFRALCVLLACLAAGPAPAVSEDDLLRPEEAFKATVSTDAGEIAVDLEIADGYYLYRKRFAFESLSQGISLAEPVFPEGEVHEDEFFGESVIFRGQSRIRIPYTSPRSASTRR